MADLTARMPLTDPTSRVMDAPAKPSMLAAGLNFAADAIGGYMDLRRQQADDKQRAAAAAEKAQEKSASLAAIRAPQEAVDLVNTSFGRFQAASGNVEDNAGSVSSIGDIAKTAGDSTGVFTDNKPIVDPQITKTIQRIGGEVKNVGAAVEQGAMPPISLSAAMNGKFNQLINQFPDQAEHILDVWKKMGIDTTLFRPARDLASDEDFAVAQRHAQESDDRQFEQKMFETGMAAVGELAATGGANGGPMTREEVISQGIVLTHQGSELDMRLKGINIQTQQAAADAAKRTELQGDKDDIIFQSLSTGLYNGANPVVNMVQNLSNSILKEPDPAKQAALWQSTGTRLHTMVENEIEHAVQLAVGRGYTPAKADQLRTSLHAQFSRVEDLFTGDFSVAQTNIKALQTIQAKLGIDGATALPVYTTLKSLGMDPTTMPGFINGIAENPELAKNLRDEIKGFNVDFGKDRASTHMTQIIRMLRGESTLAYMSPGEARAKMPDLYNVSRSLTANYARGLGGDPEMVMNGLGELSIAAGTLTPSSGAAAHTFAVAGTLGTAQVQALKKLKTEKGIDPAMATATIQAARATGAHVLNDFQAVRGKLNSESPYYKVVWDDKNGRYRIDDTLARRARQPSVAVTPGGAMPAGVVVSPGRMGQMARPMNVKVPADMQRWVDSSNTALNGLIALGPDDPSTPKGTELELRRYYGENIAPASLKDENKPINVDSEINKQFDAISSTLDKNLTEANSPVRVVNGASVATNKAGKPVTVPATAEISAQYADNPNYQAVVNAAQTAGVPSDVAIRLAYLENKFNHGNTNSAGASGVMQVRGFDPSNGQPVHDPEAMAMFGKKVADLTPAENATLGMKILKGNIDKYGLRKGVMRYLGVGSDGNLTADQYADLIVGPDIDLDTSGAMPIGQKTPYGVRY